MADEKKCKKCGMSPEEGKGCTCDDSLCCKCCNCAEDCGCGCK